MSDDAAHRLEGTRAFPLYLVCDEGVSVPGDSIAAVNEGIKQLCKAISRDPLFDDVLRLGIIAFSDTAEVILPLTQISQVGTIPSCVTKVSTSYREAFLKLKTEIDNDVNQMKSNGIRVYRPGVFFISSGSPDDQDWRGVHADLTSSSNKYRPNIISFGLPGAVKGVMRAVATEDAKTNRRHGCLVDSNTSLSSALVVCTSAISHWLVNASVENWTSQLPII